MARKRNNLSTELMDDFDSGPIYYEETTDMYPSEIGANGPETRNGTVVNSLFVKVRKEPSFESDVIKVLNKGDKVNIVGVVGNFYKISIDKDDVAYVSSNFIEEE